VIFQGSSKAVVRPEDLAALLVPPPVAADGLASHCFGEIRSGPSVRDSDDILVCRLVGGKITCVHRRLWPAIVRLARFLDKKSINALREEHSSSGAHRVRTIPFPRWVSTGVRKTANNLSEENACLQLGEWIKPYLRRDF